MECLVPLRIRRFSPCIILVKVSGINLSELILNFSLVCLISFVLGPIYSDFINLIEASVYDMLM